ncbi:RICIN domain-containing protein [Dactylosporangium cerinum]|uniref:RICIN domain-containing protein n=1 Tax=Dactylosporangium cerinum TaxID=1434730 RepID=A0ABV9VWK9_9ACTN
MDRRTFVASGVALTGGAIALSTTVASPANAAVRTAKTVTPGARGGHYWPNLAPLKATAFLKLPPGAVQPRGWLRTQLNIEADGQVQHSMKVLGVSGMSTANSAQVVQYDDNGTADHLWRLL